MVGFKKYKKRSAESLMEVIIAIGVLMLILGPAAGLYISSNRSAHLDKKMLIAEELAQEGVELVRFIRDTNTIRFKSKKDRCWRTHIAIVDLATCEQDLLISGSYRTENTPSNLLLDRLGPINSLTQNLTTDNDLNYQLRLNPKGLYTREDGVVTPYYREVNLILTDIDNADNDLQNDTDADSIEVISIVRFMEGTKIRQALATAVLFGP